MYKLLLLNAICSYLPYKKGGKGLKYSIWILFAFLALRYNFGNDYEAYSIGFKWTFSELREADVEPGYAFLVSLFHPLGFQAMVAFLSGVFCYTLYKTILRYVPENFYWLVMFSVISNADLIFIGASAIRQTAAMSLIFLSIPFLESKQMYKYCLLVIAAASFHMSAIFFLLVYPLMYVELGTKSKVIIIAVTLVLLATVLKVYVYNYIGDVTAENFEKYAERYGRGAAAKAIEGGLIGLGIRVYIAYFILRYMVGNANRLFNIFAVLSVLSFLIFSMREQVMLQRFTMYFAYFMSLILPTVLIYVKQKQILGKFGYQSLYYVTVLWNISMALTFVLTADETYDYQTIFSM